MSSIPYPAVADDDAAYDSFIEAVHAGLQCPDCKGRTVYRETALCFPLFRCECGTRWPDPFAPRAA